jgi:riboflavin synthase
VTFSRIASHAAILLLSAHAGFAVPRLAMVPGNSETSDAADLLMDGCTEVIKLGTAIRVK